MLYGCYTPANDDDDRPCGYELRDRDKACYGCFRSPQIDRAAELAESLREVQQSWAKRWGIFDHEAEQTDSAA